MTFSITPPCQISLAPPQTIAYEALAVAPDPNDLLTGESLDKNGRVPPRVNMLSTPSYALMGDDQLWNEIAKSSRQVFILVKLPEEQRGFFKGKLLINSQQVAETKAAMLREVVGLREIQDASLDLRIPRTSNGMVFPGFFATLDDYRTMLQLRRRSDLDFVEPFLFITPQSDCAPDPYTMSPLPALRDGVVSSAAGRDLVPYTFSHLRITDAWDRFRFAGLGVRVAVLDTGASKDQDQLNSRFTVGASRPPAMHVSEYYGIDDNACHHGTKVAATIAAPKDGRNVVGALWGSTLTTYRQSYSPAQVEPGAEGRVCDGITTAVAAKAHVALMAFGFPFESPVVSECIRTAFMTSQMIFVAAAGTNVPNVVFPASMNQEVIAASLVEIVPPPDRPGSGVTPMTYRTIGQGIAYGPDVDFVSVMAPNGFPTAGIVGNDVVQEISRFGATSGAVPHIAAVFGLAIQSMPGATRNQVIDRVISASSAKDISYVDGRPLPPGAVGHGIPDAYAAAGGTTWIEASGRPSRRSISRSRIPPFPTERLR